MSTIGCYDGNVYEKLLEAARSSNLNQNDPFIGYEKSLKPYLNMEFLKHHNKIAPKIWPKIHLL